MERFLMKKKETKLFFSKALVSETGGLHGSTSNSTTVMVIYIQNKTQEKPEWL